MRNSPVAFDGSLGSVHGGLGAVAVGGGLRLYVLCSGALEYIFGSLDGCLGFFV